MFDEEKLNSIGNRIKFARKKKGMTQKELAEKIHLKESSISKFEGNTQPPSLKQLVDISRVLNIRFEYLIGIDSVFDSTLDFMRIFSVSTTKECTIETGGKDSKAINNDFSFCLEENYLLLTGERRLFTLIHDLAEKKNPLRLLKKDLGNQMKKAKKHIFFFREVKKMK